MKDKELHDMDNFCLNNYDSLNDFMFYKYMCEEGNEKQQKIFLQSLGINIKGDLLIKSERVPPDIEGNKECILDFIAETEDKTLINIELQVRNTKDFNNRIVYYLTRLADTSLKRGENYNNIKKVIVIAIVNYKMNELQNYSHIYQLVNIKNLNDVLTQKLEIRAIELKKFRKFKKDFKDKKHLYLTFIDNETTHDERKELAKMDEGLRNAVKKIEEAAQTEGALRTYYKIQIERMRRENEIEEGIQEGLQKGLQKGIQKGRKEGRHEGIVKTAINLKNMGLSTEDIAKATNLTTDFIEEL